MSNATQNVPELGSETVDTVDLTASIPELTLNIPGVQAQATAEAPVLATATATAEATQAAPAEKPVDLSGFSDAEQKAIHDFVEKIDINNTDHVLLYGADAQKKLSDFNDSALDTIRTKDTGEVGDMLAKLVTELKGFNAGAEKPKGIAGLFWNAKGAAEEMKAKYSRVEVNVDSIASSLEGYQVQLLKDISMFNQLYEMNNKYFRELSMYIAAGKLKLQEVRSGALKEAMEKAAATGDAMDAQQANDLAANCDRFEKKLNDLLLTRQVSLQMAPQIRLLQNNDSLLVERIQSTMSNTLPLWKSQIVIALGMQRSQEALKAQTAVTNMTNELLKKNAEKLKVGTIETAREAERGIIDMETLVQTNQDLIDTINEVMKIQDEGRASRAKTEEQLAQMEAELKKKLLQFHG